MIRQTFRAAAIAVIAGCSPKPPSDPWSACANAGPVEYGEQTAACTTASCRQCASTLSQAWRDRQQPQWRGKFEARFLRSSVGAREVAIQQAHPEGEFAFQHCTAAKASGARCAAYSDACGTLLAESLSTTADESHRDAARAAFRNACPSAQGAVIRVLQRCEAFTDGPNCTDDACRTCVEHHLDVIKTLEASLSPEGLPSALDDLARHTPPAVVSDLMNRFTENDHPEGITQETAAQVVHSYCFQTREDQDQAPPRCLALWRTALTQPDHPEHASAWAAIAAAGPRARKNLLVTALVSNDPDGTLPPFILEHLHTLPLPGTREAMALVMGAVVVPTPLYNTLRQIMVDRGVSGDDLPPAERTNAPPPGFHPPARPAAPPLPAVPAAPTRATGG